jgi:hypothetical protein
MFDRSAGATLSDAEKAAQLAVRLEQLSAKPALTAAEKAEKAELRKAVGEIKQQGWVPKDVRRQPPRSTEQPPAAESKAKKKEAAPATGVIDRIQNWVDDATLVGGIAGAGMTVSGVGAPVGVATTLVSDVAGLANAGIDVVQAGVAAAQGDFGEAGAQLLQAGGRALGAIPYVGTAMRTAKLAKGGVEVAAKVAADVAEKSAAKATTEAFVKETADHPALTDLHWSLGKKFEGATLKSIADEKGVEQISAMAEKIRKGDTAGTTLSRYPKGDAGVNDFLQDVTAKFSKTPDVKLTAEAVGELGESTAKLLGKAGGPLTKAVDAALAKGSLRTKDLAQLRRASELLDGTTNPVIREGLTNALKAALDSKVPGKALETAIDKALLLEKTQVKAGTASSAFSVKLSSASQNAAEFREAYETLLDPRISVEGLQKALNPELLSNLTNKVGFDRLVSEARRASL